MKIVNVKVIKSNRAVYCKILTDEGITGLGESGAWGFLDASAQAIETFSQYLIGKDPRILNIFGSPCIAIRISVAQQSWVL